MSESAVGVFNRASRARLGREIETLIGQENQACRHQADKNYRQHLAQRLHTDDDPVEFQSSCHLGDTSSINVT